MNLTRRDLLSRSAASTLGALATGVSSPGLLRAADAPAKKDKKDAKKKAPWAENPYADAVFVDGAPPAIEEGSFTMVVLPDTQNYSEKFPEQFHAQTKWIAEQAKDRRIQAVLQLGDVTNRNSQPEWEVAKAAMARLDGVVPYFMVPGNHDYSAGGKSTDRTTGFTSAFPVEHWKKQRGFGGVYDREPDHSENSFHTLDVGGRKFLFLCLEFAPRNDVVRWANEVVAAHPGHQTILNTHAYMYYDETRYDWATKGPKQSWNPHGYGLAEASGQDVNDGQELWDKLVSKHENFILTLNGHVLNDGLGRMTSQTPGGREVPQVLVNFQMKPNGGDGWLRLLEFKKDGKTIDVRDYSPTLNRMNESKQNRFEMKAAAVEG